MQPTTPPPSEEELDTSTFLQLHYHAHQDPTAYQQEHEHVQVTRKYQAYPLPKVVASALRSLLMRPHAIHLHHVQQWFLEKMSTGEFSLLEMSLYMLEFRWQEREGVRACLKIRTDCLHVMFDAPVWDEPYIQATFEYRTDRMQLLDALEQARERFHFERSLSVGQTVWFVDSRQKGQCLDGGPYESADVVLLTKNADTALVVIRHPKEGDVSAYLHELSPAKTGGTGAPDASG